VKTLRELFGERVRALRKAQGLSQMALGRKSELHHTYIGGLERADLNISMDNIEKVAKGLGMKPAELFQFPTEDIAASEKEMLFMEFTAWGKDQDEQTLKQMLKIVRDVMEFKEQG